MKKSRSTIPDSDLACERRRADTSIRGIRFEEEERDGFRWERVTVTGKAGERSIGRPKGRYDTLSMKRADSLSAEEILSASEEIAGELCSLFSTRSPNRILAVGIGNADLTADAVGPRTAERIRPTMHIPDITKKRLCTGIAVLRPGVMSQSGMEAATVIRGVCEETEPDAVLVIDALACRATSRLGRTIQLSDTGIFPGSGVGNFRQAIDEASLGVRVIAIGVPTVIDSRVFLHEAFPALKADAEEEPFFVSPREIDAITDAAAEMIAGGINLAFGIG